MLLHRLRLRLKLKQMLRLGPQPYDLLRRIFSLCLGVFSDYTHTCSQARAWAGTRAVKTAEMWNAAEQAGLRLAGAYLGRYQF